MSAWLGGRCLYEGKPAVEISLCLHSEYHLDKAAGCAAQTACLDTRPQHDLARNVCRRGFAFAVTLLVISIDNIPDSYDDFIEALLQAPAFLACFLQLMMFGWGIGLGAAGMIWKARLSFGLVWLPAF